jgi:antitoxin ParD1/3/4
MTVDNTRSIIVSLTPRQVARMRSAVENGAYASDSEIIREALHLWEQHEDARLLDLEPLRKAYAEGKASGEGEMVDPVEFLKSLKAERSVGG